MEFWHLELFDEIYYLILDCSQPLFVLQEKGMIKKF